MKILLPTMHGCDPSDRNVRLLLVATAVSSFGSAMVPVALTFSMLGLGFGASGIGTVLGSETAALLALLMVGGAVADRMPRRTIMLCADVVRMASEAVLAWLLIGDHPRIWQMAVLTAVLGACLAFHSSARLGLLADIVPCHRLHRANAMFGMARAAGAIGGPAVAGLFAAAGAGGWAIALDAATYAISAACLSSVAAQGGPRAPEPGLAALLRGGWREFRAHDWLWAIVCQYGVLSIAAMAPFMVNGAILVRDSGGAAGWGFIMAAEGIGGLLGGAVAMRMAPRRPLFTCEAATLLHAVPLAFLAAGTPVAAVAFGAAMSGAGSAICNTFWNTVLQREIPSEAISRVKAYDHLGSMSLLPLGYAVAGPMAAVLGAEGTLWLGTLTVIASCLAILSMRSVRILRWA